ncbi:hypothetical protein [Piscinibacter sp. HJYY11]|uniref:hypothetical protein n=1 Tax=Piscinibacter sp. HJYY11 TaxID=2801333 RepID=UPI00191E7B6D|nr:hypothetical protein [Piscinibacter sp. HJYY11]MBL0726278.1 hypothetical protein [Piscinibacter sp. HJYY11]
MAQLSRQTFDLEAKITRSDSGTYATINLFIPSYQRSFGVEIYLLEGQTAVSEKTLFTLGEIASLTPEARGRIRELLYEDAMRTRETVAFGDPTPPPEVPPTTFLKRLFWRPNKYRFVELLKEDPRHPCHLPGGASTVETKVELLGFRIDENDLETRRFALFDCIPQWEEEHGASVVLRDGVPVAIDSQDADLSKHNGA